MLRDLGSESALVAVRSARLYLPESMPPPSGEYGGHSQPHRPRHRDQVTSSAPVDGPDRHGRQPELHLGSASGTSAATPLWGGLIALADQYADRDLGLLNAALYRAARGPRRRQAFHDVVTGNTTIIGSRTIPGYEAKPGWDAVTGWGSPKAGVLVRC